MKNNPFEISVPMGCTDEHIGRLLAAYEWGLLTSEEDERVEEHIIRCTACANELKTTWAVGSVIRASHSHRMGWKKVGAFAAAAALVLSVGLGMLDHYENKMDPLIGDSLLIRSGQATATFSYELTTKKQEGFSFNLDIP